MFWGLAHTRHGQVYRCVCVCACVSVPAYCIFIYSQSVSQVGRTQKPRPHNVPVAARWRRRKDSSAHLTFCHSNENCTSSSSSTFHAHTHTETCSHGSHQQLYNSHTQRRGYTCSDCFVQHFSNNFSVAASFALHTLRRDFFTCACMRAESLFSSASSPSSPSHWHCFCCLA